MSDEPNLASVPSGGLHHLQVKLAFLADPDHQAQPAVLITSNGADMLVRYIDDERTETITVTQPDRLAAIVARDDLCRIDRLPLLLINTHYRVVGVATGLAAPPPRLKVLVVSRLEDGAVVELVNGSDTQPAWQLLPLTRPSP